MADTIKQIGIKQADGSYLRKDIGVDYQNIDGLETEATAFKAKSADKAVSDKNDKDITEYLSQVAKDNEKIRLTNGAGTVSHIDLSMTGATPTNNGEAGFVPAPTTEDNTKFLKGDGTWDIPQDTTYNSSSNISINASNNIDLTNTTVSAGTYGPLADVTGSNGSTIVIPKFTVDSKGRLTSAGTQTYTSVDTRYTAGAGLSLTGTSFSLASHASNSAGYGLGNASQYGHVKLSNKYGVLESGGGAGTGGIAASQAALYNAYTQLLFKTQNHYVDITEDFDNGEFSDNIDKYQPGNYIKKISNGITYVAVLAHYNYFSTIAGDIYTPSDPHWVAIVLGFAPRAMGGADDFADTNMFAWLSGDCTSILRELFSGSIVATHKIGYEAGAATDNPMYAYLMSENQVYGSKIVSTSHAPTEANRQLKIFQNESFANVFLRNFGQSNPVSSNEGGGVLLRDLADSTGHSFYCMAGIEGIAWSIRDTVKCSICPIIILT